MGRVMLIVGGMGVGSYILYLRSVIQHLSLYIAICLSLYLAIKDFIVYACLLILRGSVLGCCAEVLYGRLTRNKLNCISLIRPCQFLKSKYI